MEISLKKKPRIARVSFQTVRLLPSMKPCVTRRALFFLFLLGLITLAFLFRTPAAVAQQSTGLGAGQGTITREGTNDPIPNVQVLLVGSGAQPPLTAVTDGSGKFTIRNVPAGIVTLRAQRDGYFGAILNGSYPPVATLQVGVVANETAGVRISMLPGGTISGRVFDALGRPFADAPVLVLRRAYQNGVSTLQTVDTKTTDDRGEYRLFGREDVADGAYQNAEFLSKYSGRGVPVIIEASAKSTATVAVIRN